VLTDGPEPVEVAVREALASGTASDELILNILSRRREPATPHSIITSEDRILRHTTCPNRAHPKFAVPMRQTRQADVFDSFGSKIGLERRHSRPVML